MLTAPLDSFLDVYGRHLNMSFVELWCASPTKVQREINEIAEHRVTPVMESDLTLDDVLLPSQKEFVKGYKAHMQQLVEGGRAYDDSFFAMDLDHNPAKRCRFSHTNATAYRSLFCLIGHGTIVGSNGELLLALELLSAMGTPCMSPYKEAYGCPIDFESLLVTNQITHSQVRSMAGNGWQLMPVGLLYMFVLSKLEFIGDYMWTCFDGIRNKKVGIAGGNDLDDASTVYSYGDVDDTDSKPSPDHSSKADSELEKGLMASLDQATIELSDDSHEQSQPSQSLAVLSFFSIPER